MGEAVKIGGKMFFRGKVPSIPLPGGTSRQSPTGTALPGGFPAVAVPVLSLVPVLKPQDLHPGDEPLKVRAVKSYDIKSSFSVYCHSLRYYLTISFPFRSGGGGLNES